MLDRHTDRQTDGHIVAQKKKVLWLYLGSAICSTILHSKHLFYFVSMFELMNLTIIQ